MTVPTTTRLWYPGPSAPVATPFKSDESIDHKMLAKQVVRIAKAGLGVVLLGTNGEASHLSREERKQCVVTARTALDSGGLSDTALMVGTGGGSAAITIELTADAAEAGASHCLIILPGYFAYAMGRNTAAIKDFYYHVMDQSRLPVMVYNYPAAASGVDLNSDQLIDLAKHPKCFGVKLTCQNHGKGVRLADYARSSAVDSSKKQFLGEVTADGLFQVNIGTSDCLLGAMLSGFNGCITGSGNLLPRTNRQLYDTAVRALKGDMKALQAAVDLQAKLSRASWIITKTGIQGTKYSLDYFVEKGMGGQARMPLASNPSPEVKKLVENELKGDWDFEQTLSDQF